MIEDNLNNKKIDELMRSALASNNNFIIPPEVSARAIHLIEKKTLLRELLLELMYKIMLVILSLGVLTAVLVFSNGVQFIADLIAIYTNNRQLFLSVLTLVFITIIIDQIALRFYTLFYKKLNS